MKITTTSIVNLAREYGVANIRVEMEMSPIQYVVGGIGVTANQKQTIFVKISEHRYKVADNYKVTFECDHELTASQLMFGYENFYVTDFDSLARDGAFRIFVANSDGVDEVVFARH